MCQSQPLSCILLILEEYGPSIFEMFFMNLLLDSYTEIYVDAAYIIIEIIIIPYIDIPTRYSPESACDSLNINYILRQNKHSRNSKLFLKIQRTSSRSLLAITSVVLRKITNRYLGFYYELLNYSVQ